MCVYTLKTWPEYFAAIKAGMKHFDIRKADRNFAIGEELLLKEFVPENYYNDKNEAYYTGNVCHRRITYIMTGGQFGIEPGFVVLSLEKI